MLSRVANSLYWIFRNVERVENLSRFLEVSGAIALDSGMRIEPWTPLIDTCGDRNLFHAVEGDVTPDAVANFLIQNRKNPSSIYNCILIARENARQIREILSTEMWEQINTMYLQLFHDLPLQKLLDQRWLRQVRKDCQLLYGISDVCFSRNQGWQFCQLGRLVERADKTSRMLDVKYFLLLPHGENIGGFVDQLQWIALLRSVGGYQMFRQTSQLAITPKGVAQFLLLDRNFPRSVRFCLDGIDHALAEMDPGHGSGEVALGRHVSRMRTRWIASGIDEVIRHGLHESIDRLQQDLNSLHHQLERRYFCPHDPAAAEAGNPKEVGRA